MKKLTIEEKAKRYDEAFERAKEWYNPTEADSYTCIAESIFPELKEFGDERIRETLIYHYQGDGCLSTNEYRIDYKDIRAWLEKQGYQTDNSDDELELEAALWGGR